MHQIRVNWTKSKYLLQIVKSDGFEALRYYQTAEWNALNTYSHYSKAFSVLLLAIFGASFLITTRKDFLQYLVLFTPISVCIVRYFAILTLDRYYQRFLEAVVPQIKLQYALGLQNDIEPEFYNESGLVPDRKASSGTRLWIRKLMLQGHNEVVFKTYLIWCLVSFLYPAIALIKTGMLNYPKFNILFVILFIVILFSIWIYQISNNKIHTSRQPN